MIQSLRKKVSYKNKTPSFHYALVTLLLPSLQGFGANKLVEEVMDLLSEAINISEVTGNLEGKEKGEVGKGREWGEKRRAKRGAHHISNSVSPTLTPTPPRSLQELLERVMREMGGEEEGGRRTRGRGRGDWGGEIEVQKKETYSPKAQRGGNGDGGNR